MRVMSVQTYSESNFGAKVYSGVTYGSTIVTKDFTVVVTKLKPDAAYINALFETITWETLSDESQTAVTKNLNLPLQFGDDIAVTWSSNRTNSLTNGGIVSRPMTNDVAVVL